MPNLMNYLRMANIFGPQVPIGNDLPSQGGITGTMPRPDIFGNIRFGNPEVVDPTQMGTTPIASPDDYDAGARMRELYTPQSEASDRFNTMVGAYPKAADYHPSNLRRIGAALTALAGNFSGPAGRRFQFNPNAMEAGMNVLYEPYNRQMTDWKNQIGPAQTAANLERSENINERTLAYQTVSQELRQRADEARAANQEQKTKIAADRAEVYRLKSLMPQHQFDFSGPTVKVANKQTGEVKDTGIPTGSMSDADKLALTQEQALERIHTTGAEARTTEGVRQSGREALAETRGWKIGTIPDPNDPSKQIGVQYNEITGEVKPISMGGKPTTVTPSSRGGAGGGRPETPTQTRVRQFNAARELYNTRPDLRQFIKLGTPGANDFSIVPPSKGFFGPSGPTNEQLAEINNAIYGNPAGAEMAPVSAHTPTPTGGQKTIKQYSPSRNQTRISTDGGKTWKVVEGRQ